MLNSNEMDGNQWIFSNTSYEIGMQNSFIIMTKSG